MEGQMEECFMLGGFILLLPKVATFLLLAHFHALMHLFSQQIFIEHLLCAKHSAVNKGNTVPRVTALPAEGAASAKILGL